jgi:ABC-type cobalamin transport system ATPase subunit
VELVPATALYPSIAEAEIMLVERGLQVMNVEMVGDAYAIASNYLRKTGAISDSLATNDRLLEMIVQMFHRGEYNRIRLANRAIAMFEAEAEATELS